MQSRRHITEFQNIVSWPHQPLALMIDFSVIWFRLLKSTRFALWFPLNLTQDHFPVSL